MPWRNSPGIARKRSTSEGNWDSEELLIDVIELELPNDPQRRAVG